MLLERGAFSLLKDNAGKTSLDIAKQNPNITRIYELKLTKDASYLDELFTALGLSPEAKFRYKVVFYENGFENAKTIIYLDVEQLKQWVAPGHVYELDEAIQNIADGRNPVDELRSVASREAFLEDDLFIKLNLNQANKEKYKTLLVQNGFELRATVGHITRTQLGEWGFLPGHIIEFEEALGLLSAGCTVPPVTTRTSFLESFFNETGLGTKSKDECKARFVEHGFEIAKTVVHVDASLLREWKMKPGHVSVICAGLNSLRADMGLPALAVAPPGPAPPVSPNPAAQRISTPTVELARGRRATPATHRGGTATSARASAPPAQPVQRPSSSAKTATPAYATERTVESGTPSDSVVESQDESEQLAAEVVAPPSPTGNYLDAAFVEENGITNAATMGPIQIHHAGVSVPLFFGGMAAMFCLQVLVLAFFLRGT